MIEIVEENTDTISLIGNRYNMGIAESIYIDDKSREIRAVSDKEKCAGIDAQAVWNNSRIVSNGGYCSTDGTQDDFSTRFNKGG